MWNSQCWVCCASSASFGRSVASCTNYLIYQEYCKDHNRTDRTDNCGNADGGGAAEGGEEGRLHAKCICNSNCCISEIAPH